jgi:hypothetical protein
MNKLTTTNSITGIVEHRGNTVVVKVPLALLTLDTLSFAIGRIEALRLEALDPDYTPQERRAFLNRASSLDEWLNGDCCGTVPFGVDFTLYQRCALKPAVVMHHNLDAYLDQLLTASEIVSANTQEFPAFAFRNNAGESELWLTDIQALRNARLFPGPDVTIVEANPEDVNAIIGIQATDSFFLMTTVLA